MSTPSANINTMETRTIEMYRRILDHNEQQEQYQPILLAIRKLQVQIQSSVSQEANPLKLHESIYNKLIARILYHSTILFKEKETITEEQAEQEVIERKRPKLDADHYFSKEEVEKRKVVIIKYALILWNEEPKVDEYLSKLITALPDRNKMLDDEEDEEGEPSGTSLSRQMKRDIHCINLLYKYNIVLQRHNITKKLLRGGMLSELIETKEDRSGKSIMEIILQTATNVISVDAKDLQQKSNDEEEKAYKEVQEQLCDPEYRQRLQRLVDQVTKENEAKQSVETRRLVNMFTKPSPMNTFEELIYDNFYLMVSTRLASLVVTTDEQRRDRLIREQVNKIVKHEQVMEYRQRKLQKKSDCMSLQNIGILVEEHVLTAVADTARCMYDARSNTANPDDKAKLFKEALLVLFYTSYERLDTLSRLEERYTEQFDTARAKMDGIRKTLERARDSYDGPWMRSNYSSKISELAKLEKVATGEFVPPGSATVLRIAELLAIGKKYRKKC